MLPSFKGSSLLHTGRRKTEIHSLFEVEKFSQAKLGKAGS